jgi:lysophospholipase L1-like esterase
MTKPTRLIGGAAGLLGLTVVAIALLLDTFGFGDAPGIGWQQRLIAFGGALVAVIGASVAFRLRFPRSLTSRETLGRLVLGLMSLLFSIFMAELGLRIIRPPSVSFDHQPTIYRPDPVLGFRYVPGSHDRVERLEFRQPVQVNNVGFIDDDFSLSPPSNVTRIAAIGDSVTAGMQVGRGYSYPDVLESELNESGQAACPCEVLNFGVDGMGTFEQAYIFEEFALDYQPDIVILAYVSSDLVDAAYPTIRRDVYRNYIIYYRDDAERVRAMGQVDDVLSGGGAALRFSLRYSYILRALYNSWLDRQGTPEPNLLINKNKPDDIIGTVTLEEAEAQIIEDIEGMHRACQEAGCELVVVALPSKEETAGDIEVEYLSVLEAVSERGIHTFSLLEPIREHTDQWENLYWQRDSHFNQDGYRLVAEEILAYLQREGLL